MKDKNNTNKTWLTSVVFLGDVGSVLPTDDKNEVVETRAENFWPEEVAPEDGDEVEAVAERRVAFTLTSTSAILTTLTTSSLSSLLTSLLASTLSLPTCWSSSLMLDRLWDYEAETDISGSEPLTPPPRSRCESTLESRSKRRTIDATLIGARCDILLTMSTLMGSFRDVLVTISPLPPATVDAATLRRPKIGLFVAEGIFSQRSFGSLKKKVEQLVWYIHALFLNEPSQASKLCYLLAK